MRVAHLSSRGIVALPDLECDFVSSTTGRPHDLVLLTGAPASGKTRLSELMLAVFELAGPYLGIVRSSEWVADPARGARVDMGIWLSEEELRMSSARHNPTLAVARFGATSVECEVERGVGRVLATYDHDGAQGKREYFPENRQRAWGARADGLSPLEQSLLRSSKSPQKYSFIPRFLSGLANNPKGYRVFDDALSKLSETVRYVATPSDENPKAGFINRDSDGLRYTELSGSEVDAVLIAATVALIGLSHSVVFLDRPELFVPSDRLVSWVQGLQSLGTDNQWFIATNDPHLIGSVEGSQIVSLDSGSEAPAANGSSSRRAS